MSNAKKSWDCLRRRANKKGPLNWERKDFLEWYAKRKKVCEYCKIEEGKFIDIWGKFYGGKRGRRLEVDRKENTKGYSEENCVLACALCNCAKSDKLNSEDMIKIGEIIKAAWKKKNHAQRP